MHTASGELGLPFLVASGQYSWVWSLAALPEAWGVPTGTSQLMRQPVDLFQGIKGSLELGAQPKFCVSFTQTHGHVYRLFGGTTGEFE